MPPELLAAVERGLAPVRPIASPARRVLALLPLGLALLVAIPAFWGGLRRNVSELGPMVAWGLSGLQALAGLLIVGAALREAVPGRELSARAVAATVGAALALFVGLTFLTESLVPPAAVPPGVFGRYAWECFWMAAASSVPVLAAAVWLASRALPTRPALAGAIYGLGAGIMADAGVRLFCWVSSPAHVLLAHGGAILFLAATGAAAATIVERIKRRIG
ncbi:MAG TPA: NrsF family protein [Thermoanaerobaculia bacterium]|nr:NrsF family protein [Thermoanaerobaculia bacterium]